MYQCKLAENIISVADKINYSKIKKNSDLKGEIIMENNK